MFRSVILTHRGLCYCTRRFKRSIFLGESDIIWSSNTHLETPGVPSYSVYAVSSTTPQVVKKILRAVNLCADVDFWLLLRVLRALKIILLIEKFDEAIRKKHFMIMYAMKKVKVY